MGHQPLDLLAAIRAAYPDATPEQLKASLTPEFLTQMNGKVPGYSSLSAPQIHDVKTATIGSCVVCYAQDTSVRGNHEPLVVIIQRADRGNKGEPRYGVLGGYTNLGNEVTGGEQPKVGAAREVTEEAVDDQGKALINPAPDRMRLLTSGIDYRKPELPVSYHCHTLELMPQELATLTQHCAKLEQSQEYRQAVFEKSHREVVGMKVMPISQALAIPKESFAHPHEYEVIEALEKQLKQQRAAQTR